MVLVATQIVSAHAGSQADDESARAAEVSEDTPKAVRGLVDAQITLLLTQRTVVGGRRYPLDCTGTVLAAYEYAERSLFAEFAGKAGGGVTRLYRIAEEHDLLRTGGTPSPGDVIFWDNTYDADEDQRFDDELTHAGIVLTVHDDGSIEYVHHNYRRGIVVERMDLSRPEVFRDENGALVNSPMRMAGDRHIKPDRWLASHLFRAYAPLHQLFD